MRRHWPEIGLLAAAAVLLLLVIVTPPTPVQPSAEDSTNTDTIALPDTARTHMDTILDCYSMQLEGCRQLITVGQCVDMNGVVLKAFERMGNNWTSVDSLNFAANIGYGGFAAADSKREGDGRTPTGMFAITRYFSKEQDFTARLKKIDITPNTIWIDDPKDSLYNTYFEQTPKKRRKGEKLLRKDGLYNYAMVIDYNQKREPGKGSAIFLHCWSKQGKPTLGCVAVEENNLLKTFEWIDSSANPMILIFD